ncbi:MAG: xylulokinase [Planctomycetota bacterium]|jgi:xylulokinase
MANSTHLLGIDVGTGGCKALLIDTAGAVIATATTDYPLSTPKPLWSEQDPHDWWTATATSIQKVLQAAGLHANQVAGVGLTGQMHGLVALDRAGDVLRPAILWNDQRCAAECEAIHRQLGTDTVLAMAGKPALASFTAPKILWVQEHEPQVFGAMAKVLLPKDYIRFRLTGAYLSDVADASGTLLFDVGRRAWSHETIDALAIPRAWLPEVTESVAASAAVSAEGAEHTGLLEGTPVIAGAGDQAAEAVGCGITEHGAVSVTIGTSGVVFAATETVRLDLEGRLHAYCHAIPGMWHVMGVMLSAGGSLRWYRDTLGRDEIDRARRAGVDPYDLLIEDAGGVPPGCDGLLFLPYLTGERTPHPDPRARGAFVGLTLRHGKAHLTRAVMEGVTFGLKDSLELTRALGIPVERVRVSGGGARSAMWRQMMADVFGVEVVTVNTVHGAAFGAALLAGVGTGCYGSVPDAARSVVRETGSARPGADAGIYGQYYARYRALYPLLAPEFLELGSLDERGFKGTKQS